MQQTAPRHPVPLSSRLAAGELAWRSVRAVGAALSPDDITPPDPDRIAAAYRSDRHLLVDGEAPDVWSPLSRFWRTADGWVRTHGNYPHHASALRAGLELPPDASPEDVSTRLATMEAGEAGRDITGAGGLCVVVHREDPQRDSMLREHPLVQTRRMADSPARPLPSDSMTAPLAGVRVLDLTRVIAGPVATRTLAFAGAEVLRLDPPHIPEPDWQHFDTGHGKRSALLDVALEASRLHRLLADADVIVFGYRPTAMRRLGLSAELLAERHPHLVIAQLSAWPGEDSPRGFDSLVQAESGISWLESADGSTPGALPAQVLDHSAGYLLAAAIVDALHRRARRGCGWHVRTSLRRVAAELLGMPRGEHPMVPAATAVLTQDFDVAGHAVTTVAPAVRWPGSPEWFAPPRPWGGDLAEW